jgi:hypothetical protein
MTRLAKRLDRIDKQVGRAVVAIAGDLQVSPELASAVREFYWRSQATLDRLRDADRPTLYEFIQRFERAGANASRAAEADPGARASTREAVVDAHRSVQRLKSELDCAG